VEMEIGFEKNTENKALALPSLELIAADLLH
jgi:hypothetical protein